MSVHFCGVYIVSFYERFIELCKKRGVSPSGVTKAIGIGTANATYWKKGSIPSGETVLKLSKYFGVTTDFLLGITNFSYSLESDEEEKESNEEDYSPFFIRYIESLGYEFVFDGEDIFLIREADNFWFDLTHSDIKLLDISIQAFAKFQVEDLLSKRHGENPEHS